MTVVKVSSGVWRAGTRFVNWYIVDGGSRGITLVDAGLPAYERKLARSLAEIGRDARDVRAVVLTHGHLDHTGMAAARAQPGALRLLPGNDRLPRARRDPGSVAARRHAADRADRRRRRA